MALMSATNASATGYFFYAHAKIQTNMTGAGYVYGIPGAILKNTPTGETLSPEMALRYQLESQNLVDSAFNNVSNDTLSLPFSIVAAPREGYRFVGWRDEKGNMLTDEKDNLFQPSVATSNYALIQESNNSFDPHANDPDYYDALFTAVFEPTDSFEVNGVWYKIHDDAAYVVRHPNSSETYNAYKGDLVIQPEVTFLGHTYTVKGIDHSYPDPFSSSDITSIRIPNTINGLFEGSFYGCTKLKKVVFDENGSELLYIGPSVFGRCTSLTDITLPARTKGIDSYAFSECTSLKTLTIPSRCDTIGYGFIDNCDHLETLIMRQSKAPVYRTETEDNLRIPDKVKIYTSPAAYAYYRTSFGWRTLYPDRVFVYLMGLRTGTYNTASFGAMSRPRLDNINGLKAFQTTHQIKDGKLVVRPVSYAYSDTKFMGDGVIFKVNKPQTVYLCTQKVDASLPETDDSWLVPQATSSYVYPSDDENVTIYTLDPNDGVWVRLSTTAIVGRSQCYLAIPKKASELPGVLEMVLEDGSNPFGLWGDVNGDGIVDVSDVNHVIDVVLGGIIDSENCDLDGNTIVDVADVNIVIDIVLGKY